MRKFYATLLVLTFVGAMYSEGLKLGGWIGYSTVNMAKVNDEFQKTANDAESLGYTVTFNKLGGALSFGGMVGYGINPNLTVAAKVGYLYCFPMALDMSIEASGNSAKFNYKLAPSLLPLMVGVNYSFPVGEALSIGLEGFVGYALAFASLEQKMEMTIAGTTTADSAVIPLEGSGLVVELGANGEYKLSSALSLGLVASYRIANIAEMKASKDVTSESGTTVVNKGDVMKDADGNPLPFDYSGFTIGLSLNFKL